MDAVRVVVGLGYLGLLVAAGAGFAVNVGAVTVPASVADAAVLEVLLRTVRAFPPVGLVATVALCVWGLWRLAGP
jgi:ABC-type glucose/galactose transport system permease subunit